MLQSIIAKYRAVVFGGVAAVAGVVLLLDGFSAISTRPEAAAVVEPTAIAGEASVAATPTAPASTAAAPAVNQDGLDRPDLIASTFERLETAPELAIDTAEIVADQARADEAGQPPATRLVRTTIVRPDDVREEPPAPAPMVDSASTAANVAPLATESLLTMVRVGSDQVNVRAGPTTSSEKLAMLGIGQEVEATGRVEDWVQVVYEDGRSGWVSSQYLVDPDLDALAVLPPPPAAPPDVAEDETNTRIVGGAGVNVRSAPSSSASALFQLPGGERVLVTDSESGWVRVVDDRDRTGWVYSGLLES